MTEDRHVKDFIDTLFKSIEKNEFISIRFAQKRDEASEIKSAFAKLVELKKGLHLSFVYRYPTKDITKNFTIDDSRKLIQELIDNEYLQAELSTTDYNYYLTISVSGRIKLRRKRNDHLKHVSKSHDHEKNRMIRSENNIYLRELGVTTEEFRVRHQMQDKYKQINKYTEIVDDILKKTKLPTDAHIVDMGSGKGYLTFSLYDYFTNIRGENPNIYGIELRPELVEKCTKVAEKCDFKNLHFIAENIQNIDLPRIDFLLALHACDTATDDAILHGIKAGSQLIVCAPCCHKQVRKSMNTEGNLEHITKHGILRERQAEILTDTIRSLILEAYGYKTRVFEFISTQHTPKNVLIVASLDDKRESPDMKIIEEIREMKRTFGIGYHHLERIMGIEGE